MAMSFMQWVGACFLGAVLGQWVYVLALRVTGVGDPDELKERADELVEADEARQGRVEELKRREVKLQERETISAGLSKQLEQMMEAGRAKGVGP